MTDPASDSVDLFLVEDDPDDRLMIVRALQRIKPQVNYEEINDGVALIRAIETGRSARVILLDLNMPRMNGTEVIHRLIDMKTHLEKSVVVLTTSASEEERQRLQALGILAFITKPDRYADLVKLFERYIAVWLRDVDRIPG